MSSTHAEPLDLVERGLDELAAIDPGYRTTAEKQQFLLRVARAKARLVAEELRVLAASDDIAETTGDRSTATWLAHQTRDNHGTVCRHAALASALDSRWTQTADALGSGDVNLTQARVVVEALEALPKDLGDDLLVKAEAYLVEQAAELGPRELRNLGRGVLEHLAPDIADEADYQRLLAEEQVAGAATRLTMRRRGDGSTDIHARVPDAAAGRLSAYLNAYTSPRRQGDDVASLPIHRQRGQAFVALLENIPTDSLPRHGGTSTTVMITLDHDTLISGLGVATTSTGDRITADSCTMPVDFCEAHHIVPWSRGGATSLADSTLLCSFHHHRAHDPAWRVHHHANGRTSFTRRT